MSIFKGGCHCGRIEFEVEGDLERVTICTCSLCSKQGYMHWLVTRAQFRLCSSVKNLATYSFTTARARHNFCTTCGIAPFAMPRAHPHSIDVNVRCLEGVDFGTLAVEYLDRRSPVVAPAATESRVLNS